MTQNERLPSFYLLEYVVHSARERTRANAYAHGTLAGLREQWEKSPCLPAEDVFMGFPFLYLWVVRRGEITQGIDLYPLLRTGSPEDDRMLPRVLAVGRTEVPRDEPTKAISDVLNFYWDWGIFRAGLSVLTRLLTLHDKVTAPGADPGESVRAEYARLLEQIGNGDLPEPDDDEDDDLFLDWDAIADVAPRLEEPLLGPGGWDVRWAEGVEQNEESYLSENGMGNKDVRLYAGRTDLAWHDDDRLYEEDKGLDRFSS
ncbi:hypothetical protein ACIBCM_32385 [Streptomyces sp. NPDC051018]|uniref:hypothetical protein n=1 Tax=Streptomyces sp. NPDC051018 TaxID=3365639 RepID=UPI0037A7AFC3